MLHVAVDYDGRPVAEHVATSACAEMGRLPAAAFAHRYRLHARSDRGWRPKQLDNINKALALWRRNRPIIRPRHGSMECRRVLWAMDSYLRRQPPEKQQRLVDAIRAGQVELVSFTATN